MSILFRLVDWLTTPYTIILLLKDPTIPRTVKLRAIAGLIFIFAYIISPIDLVPDFIPFAGWLDDIIVVPLIIALIRKLTPEIDIIERKQRAQATVKRVIWRIVLIISFLSLLTIIWLGLLIYLLVRFFTHC